MGNIVASVPIGATNLQLIGTVFCLLITVVAIACFWFQRVPKIGLLVAEQIALRYVRGK